MATKSVAVAVVVAVELPMHLNTFFVSPADPNRVLSRVQQVQEWSTWLGTDVFQTADGVQLLLPGPPRVRVHLAVEHLDDGVLLTLIESPLLSSLTVRITVATDPDGARLSWNIAATYRLLVPGPLLREVEQHWVPSWSKALLAANPALENAPVADVETASLAG